MKLSFKDILLAIILPVILLVIDKSTGEIKINNTMWTFIQSLVPYLLLFYSIFYLANRIMKTISRNQERAYQQHQKTVALIDMLTAKTYDHYKELLKIDPKQDPNLLEISIDMEYQKFRAQKLIILCGDISGKIIEK